MVINPKKYHFRVKDWKKMQHYHSISKTHSPSMSWYKFYFREYIQDPHIMKLTHEERCFLYEGVWGIASQMKGRLPSPEDIAFRIRQEEDRIKELIDKFLDLEIIIPYDPNQDDVLLHELAYEKLKLLYSDLEQKEFKKQFPDKGLSKVLDGIVEKYFKDVDFTKDDVDELLYGKRQSIDNDTGEIIFVDRALHDQTSTEDGDDEVSPSIAKIQTPIDLQLFFKYTSDYSRRKEAIKHAEQIGIQIPDAIREEHDLPF
jgi:hypothetical protein